MRHDTPLPVALSIDERQRIRPLLTSALSTPEDDHAALREEVRTLARRAREEGQLAADVIRALEEELRAVATPDTPYFDFDQVRERVALWCHTAFRR